VSSGEAAALGEIDLTHSRSWAPQSRERLAAFLAAHALGATAAGVERLTAAYQAFAG